jgi:hypothetical protein
MEVRRNAQDDTGFTRVVVGLFLALIDSGSSWRHVARSSSGSA